MWLCLIHLSSPNTEVNEELAVLRDSLHYARAHTRTSTPAEAVSSSNGRRSVDDLQLSDLLSRHRPGSRTGARPSSRNGMTKHSPPMPRAQLPSIPSSSKIRALGSSRAAGHSRTESRDARPDDGNVSGIITSPSSTALRSRQSLGPSSYRSSARAPRLTTTTASSTRDQPGTSKSMIGDMFARMRALEKRLADTRNGVAINDVQSAIPRPSSRLGSSIGPGSNTVNLTPRRSIDTRREDTATPSSIPVPLYKSTSSRRPVSRLSSAAGLDQNHLPSSLRCQTPTMDNGAATLEFLDQDPSKIRRRSNLSTATTSIDPNVTGTFSQSRPRGSTLTMGGFARTGESLRKSANPGTGKPAPPISWKPGQSVSRLRSTSIGPNS